MWGQLVHSHDDPSQNGKMGPKVFDEEERNPSELQGCHEG